MPRPAAQLPRPVRVASPPPRPIVGSDFGTLPRLIARVKALETRMTDQQVSQLADWFIKRKHKASVHETTWDYLYSQGLLDVLEHDQRVAVSDALNDEVFKARLDAVKQEAKTDDVPELPGLGLELGYLPEAHFPILRPEHDYSWRASTLLNREVCMLNVIEKLTNKPEWWLKCHDDEIAGRWKQEMLGMDWPKILDLPHADFTPAIADAVIDEIRKKAPFYEKTGLIPVMDYSAAAIKSDTILTDGLTRALKDAVAPLENVPEDQKDWHPGSNNQVLDLVHPSLWPLIYGKTRWVPGKRIGLKDALTYSGTGLVILQPLHIERAVMSQSNEFQWLPCDVGISSDGKATIESYINNLHPVHHEGLYNVIEKFIEMSLPAWNLVYSWPHGLQRQRLSTLNATWACSAGDSCVTNGYRWCSSSNRPLEAGEPDRDEVEDEYDHEMRDYKLTPRRKKDLEWFAQTHEPEIPDPSADVPLEFDASDVASSGFFEGTSRIQVVVKLANIHLTPESPTYEGGSWHVEGMLNEHICATALYYYDSENISDSYLSFRTRANEEDMMGELRYEQGQFDVIERIFAIKEGHSTIQDIGKVLTRSGRALFFPNVYQHRVSPFELTDPTRPGHRKILALFLVDPDIPVISTSNVGPQQRHWWDSDAEFTSKLLSKLPVELQGMVMQEADHLMDLDEAKKVRLELMEERTGVHEQLNTAFEIDNFNFCEH